MFCSRRLCGAAVLMGMGLAACSLWAQPQEATTDVTAARLAQLRKLTLTGHDAEAVQEAENWRATQPATPGLDLLEGDALYNLNRLKEADEAYARALALNPHDEAAAQMRGLTLFRLGRPKDAIPLLEVNHAQAAQAKADPTYVLALCYMDTLRFDDARRAFAGQYGFGPETAAAYLVTARMLLRREFKPVAKQYAEKALALQPGLPGAHVILGEMALGQNHMEDAIGEFGKEKEIDPLDGVVYERLGDAYTRLGKFSDAQRVLQQAVLLEPNATGPYILLGKALLKQGQTTGAATFLEKAERMDPANYMTHNLLAQVYKTEGRQADASREFALTAKSQATDEPQAAGPK